jgi:hypothetical protein
MAWKMYCMYHDEFGTCVYVVYVFVVLCVCVNTRVSVSYQVNIIQLVLLVG